MDKNEKSLIEAVARLEEQSKNMRESIEKLSGIVYSKIDDLYNKFLEYRQEVASQQQLQVSINDNKVEINELDKRTKALELVKLSRKEYKTIIALLFLSPLLAIVVPLLIEKYAR
jgi:hypothetical protein